MPIDQTPLTEAVRLAPDDADTRFNLEFLYHQRGDLDRAVAESKQAIRLKPMLDRASHGLGVIYLRRGELGYGDRASAGSGEAAVFQRARRA